MRLQARLSSLPRALSTYPGGNSRLYAGIDGNRCPSCTLIVPIGTGLALSTVKVPNRVMKKSVNTILMVAVLTGCCLAQTSAFKVLPWNGHSAALSLTFDDSRAVHLDVVVPELNKRHLHATFFLIVSKTTRLDDWRKAQAARARDRKSLGQP